LEANEPVVAGHDFRLCSGELGSGDDELIREFFLAFVGPAGEPVPLLLDFAQSLAPTPSCSESLAASARAWE
jgi:hypothetical protein